MTTEKDILAVLAKAWLKALPCLSVREKEKFWKELVKDKMSLIIWPHEGCEKHLFFIAEMDTSESPSMTELRSCISWAKQTAFRAARVSRTAT